MKHKAKTRIVKLAAVIAFVMPFTLAAGPLDTWSIRTSGTTNFLPDITYANNSFVAVGFSGAILTSLDGVTWTGQNASTTNNLAGITYANGTWVASGFLGTILTSTNLVSWATQTAGTTNNLLRIAFGNGIFVVAGNPGIILTSTDATNWISRNSGTTNQLQGVAYGNGTFVIVGKGGVILTSPTGATWTSRSSGTSVDFPGVTYGRGTFVASGGGGTILTSPDGVTWASQNSGTTKELSGVNFGNGVFVAVGQGGGLSRVIDTSPDGVNWTIRVSETASYLARTAYGAGTFVSAGNLGTLLQSGLFSFDGSDDFNDSSKDPTNWGADFAIGGGFLVETNQRLEFATAAVVTDSAVAVRPWILNWGSFTQNWEVQIDLALPAINLSADQEIFSGLLIYPGNAPFTDLPSSYMYVQFTQHDTTRRFKTIISANGQKTTLGTVTNTTILASVRMAFDANTKVVSSFFDEDGPNCGYSWRLFGATNVDVSWSMTSTSLFSVAVFVQSTLIAISPSNNMFADNFRASSGATPKLGITPGNGKVVISWSTDPPACRLESTSTLTPPICWQVVPNTPGIVSANFTVTNTISSANTFYRLSR